MLRICVNPPTMRVVDGADPYKLKLKYSQQKKQKCTLYPVSARTSQFPHPNLNREVRHSLTWHSGESESALERFEPVAVAML